MVLNEIISQRWVTIPGVKPDTGTQDEFCPLEQATTTKTDRGEQDHPPAVRFLSSVMYFSRVSGSDFSKLFNWWVVVYWEGGQRYRRRVYEAGETLLSLFE